MSFLKTLSMKQIVRILTEEQSSLCNELKIRSMKFWGYEGIEARTIEDANTIIYHITCEEYFTGNYYECK